MKKKFSLRHFSRTSTLQSGVAASLQAMKILIVEDERKMAQAIQQGLESEGYSAQAVHTSEEAARLLEKNTFDLVLLDIMLPESNGLGLLRKMRGEGFNMPVLLLTALDSIEDRVVGLDAGADDYLIKPFAFPELSARVRALLRRVDAVPESFLEYAGLHLDLATRTASREGLALDLTAKEFDLLEYLMLNRGHVVSREMLTRDVWRETSRYTTLDNVIDVQVARLRRKVDQPFDAPLLHTVRGIGFILKG
jgi:two-component system, OmpR family, copper resistance phosphate regulon response regulator CusR